MSYYRFVKFLDCFYFTLITQKKEVGCIGGNFIYAIKSTEMFPIRKRDEPVRVVYVVVLAIQFIFV